MPEHEVYTHSHLHTHAFTHALAHRRTHADTHTHTPQGDDKQAMSYFALCHHHNLCFQEGRDRC